MRRGVAKNFWNDLFNKWIKFTLNSWNDLYRTVNLKANWESVTLMGTAEYAVDKGLETR